MANLLTAIRLILTLPLAWGLAHEGFLPASALFFLLVLAIGTDYFDGKVARATNTASARGMLFDHGSDCFFVSCCLFAIAHQGIVSYLLPVLILIAFTQYVLDSYFLFKQKQLRMSFLGRWNGIFYFSPILFYSASGLNLFGGISESLVILTTVTSLLLIISTLASIVDRALAPLREQV